MPRNFKDEGDRGMRAPDRFGMNDDIYAMDYFDTISDEDRELKELERRLNEEVDEDFFQEPRRFNTLHRVIDVLGLQMIDEGANDGSKKVTAQSANLEQNPAYRSLKGQQQIVEGAIEHMAVIHCADLNGSVIQVGKVARQFSDAVTKVRNLRKQVHDIQSTLGASAKNEQEKKRQQKDRKTNRPQTAAAMSLRELWMKKLECEATLALLEKLDIIRAAPSQFDQLVAPPTPRIGAAVLTVTHALNTMFSDDVAQVQALHKIMEQLMLRKQKAEEICWYTLADVTYLRTGNGLLWLHAVSSNNDNAATAEMNSSQFEVSAKIHNPFMSTKTRFATDDDDNYMITTGDGDDDSVQSDHSGASLFSLEDDSEDAKAEANEPPPPTKTPNKRDQLKSLAALEGDGTLQGTGKRNPCRMMIPLSNVEAELDLEADERRCLEEIALAGMFSRVITGATTSNRQSQRQQQLPRYADSVLALRILVECLAKLSRLDDVERMFRDEMEGELSAIVQREQARTFSRLEKQRRNNKNIRGTNQSTDSLKEFRRHLTGVLSAFGNVLVRFSHLAEVLRIRISSDRGLMQKVESPSSLMRSVITTATSVMHAEIIEFLKACLTKKDDEDKDGMENPSVRGGSAAFETGLFSLGIVEANSKDGKNTVSTATRSNVMEMSTERFVRSILFPKTGSEPEVRNALVFRRIISRWTQETENLKRELAIMTKEDMSSATYRESPSETAIGFLDNVIQKDLLPVLQEEAVNGTVKGLEKAGSFDPILGRTMFTQSHSNGPDVVEMCTACKTMYDSTGPLFLALHRLPPGGEMYLPLVAVLEHVMLTFISRVKQQVHKITDRKTALTLLMKEGKGASVSAIMERRKAASMLMRAYFGTDGFDSAEDADKQSGIAPITPPPSDSARKQVEKEENPLDDIAEGIEGEEQLLNLEMAYLKAYLDFDTTGQSGKIVLCSEDELMKSACLSHSLLKLAGFLEKRLISRIQSGGNKSLASTRALREAIKTIRTNGMKMAKFCRLELLMQTVSRMAKICNSSTLVARDAVRIPSSVNDLGEYLTGASDNLREAAGNAVGAYAFSSLEQYIPVCLMQTVRVVAAGRGIVTKSPLTLNGIEALDRSGSVLYRDLKGATSFNNSFWDMELAAIYFECSASFMAMMELEMEELVAYYTANHEEFPEEDFKLMFLMNGPRRRGDLNKYLNAKEQVEAMKKLADEKDVQNEQTSPSAENNA